MPEEDPPPAPPKAPSFEETLKGLEALGNWKDAVMLSVLMSYYSLADFNRVHPKGKPHGKNLANVLQLLGLIRPDVSRRFKVTTRGRAFVSRAIAKKILTPYDGADFIVQHGTKFGRKIMFDNVFVPNLDGE